MTRHLWILSLLLVAACQGETTVIPSSVLMLRVQAADSVREAGSTLRVRIARKSGDRWQERTLYDLAFPRILSWPTDLPVAAKDEDTKNPVELVVAALDARGELLAEARTITDFVRREVKLIELGLHPCGDDPSAPVCEPDRACHGAACQTCSEGTCINTTYEPGISLPSFDADASTRSSLLDAGLTNDDGGYEDTSPLEDADQAGADAADQLLHDAELTTPAPEPCDQSGPRCNLNSVQECVSGYWTSGRECQHTTCVAGACVGSCAPDERRCAGLFMATAEACQSGGEWGVDTSQGSAGVCALACDRGRCTNACGESESYRCSATAPGQSLVCKTGILETDIVCPQRCRPVDGCVVSPSCTPTTLCAGESCCSAPLVPGGQFKRSYDGIDFPDDRYVATVSPFHMDRFEVSVSRFRRWLAVYDQAGSKPALGSGKTMDPNDQGWQQAWSAELPANAEALRAAIAVCDLATFTEQAGANDAMPINCINWYVAMAFCIWDGGRLPTEAEWNFAASAGSQQRVYPWTKPGETAKRDFSHAAFDVAPLANVGSHASGDGYWGHADLIGNVEEWVRDAYMDPYPTASCSDCVNLLEDGSTVQRGGAAQLDEERANPNARWRAGRKGRSNEGGFRCARSL